MTAFVSKPFEVPLTVDLIRRLRRPATLLTATPADVMDAAQGLAHKPSGVAANLALPEADHAAQ